jgi:hypothetical protein
MNYQIKKSVFIIIIGIVLSLISFTQAAMYGGGSGTSEDPYQIWDPNQMNTIGLNPSDWGSHFKLMADIDMSNIVGNYITTFTGTFDGNGHVISNLTFTPFSSTNNAIIMNLGIENITLFSAGGSDAGGLVGYQCSVTITNCYSTGTVTSSLSSAGGWWDCNALVLSRTATVRLRLPLILMKLTLLLLPGVWWAGNTLVLSRTATAQVRLHLILILILLPGVWWGINTAIVLSRTATARVRLPLLLMKFFLLRGAWWESKTLLALVPSRTVTARVRLPLLLLFILNFLLPGVWWGINALLLSRTATAQVRLHHLLLLILFLLILILMPGVW